MKANGKSSLEFDRLLEESFKKRKSIEPGSRWESKVVSIKNDYIFLRTKENQILGNVSTEEFKEVPLPKLGEILHAYFLKEESGDYYFTTCLHGDTITADNLQIAMTAEIPVMGQIAQETNGGYEIRLGSFHAFLPFSQIDLREKGKELYGMKLKFIVSDIQPKQSKIVVSQKKVSERERESRKRVLQEELKEGSFVTCKVKSIHKFGLIVDLDGIDALVPASEASHKRNSDLEKEFQIGESLRAKVQSLQWEEKKITLSVKDFLTDPWANAVTFKESDLLEGEIESIKPFGIFVKLNDSFGGLVPNKETGVPQRTPVNTVFHVGQKVEVVVLEVNPEKKQIALSIAKAKELKERQEYQQYLKSEETVESVSSFGLLLKKSLENKKNK